MGPKGREAWLSRFIMKYATDSVVGTLFGENSKPNRK